MGAENALALAEEALGAVAATAERITICAWEQRGRMRSCVRIGGSDALAQRVIPFRLRTAVRTEIIVFHGAGTVLISLKSSNRRFF